MKHLLRVCFNKINSTKSLSWFAGDEEYTSWSAGHTNNCGVAILVCIALKGYHPLTTYQWFEDDTLLNNPYPLLYTEKIGKYKCVLTSGQKERVQEVFFVFGMYVSFFGNTLSTPEVLNSPTGEENIPRNVLVKHPTQSGMYIYYNYTVDVSFT